MPKLRAAGRFNFRGRWLTPGEIFEASDEEASELCAPSIGYASRAPESAELRSESYEREDMRVADAPVSARAARRRKRYKRRDLRAKT